MNMHWDQWILVWNAFFPPCLLSFLNLQMNKFFLETYQTCLLWELSSLFPHKLYGWNIHVISGTRWESKNPEMPMLFLLLLWCGSSWMLCWKSAIRSFKQMVLGCPKLPWLKVRLVLCCSYFWSFLRMVQQQQQEEINNQAFLALECNLNFAVFLLMNHQISMRLLSLLESAERIHRETTPFCVVKPIIPPLVFVSRLQVCSIVLSHAVWENPWSSWRWTEKCPLTNSSWTAGCKAGSSHISSQYAGR